MNFYKFCYLNGKPFIYGARILVRQLKPEFCTLYMHIDYSPVKEELKGECKINTPTIKTINALRRNGFRTSEVDFNNSMNKFDFEKIRKMNPPVIWWEHYLRINRVSV